MFWRGAVMSESLSARVEKRNQILRDKFIQDRANYETRIEDFFEAVDALPEGLLVNIELPEDREPQTIFSSLYKDVVDKKLYEKQLNGWNALVASVEEVVDSYKSAIEDEALSFLQRTDKWVK